MRNNKTQPPAIVHIFFGAAAIWFIAGLFTSWEYFVYAVICLLFGWLFYKD